MEEVELGIKPAMIDKLIQNIPLPLSVVGSGRILSCNHFFGSFFGRDCQELTEQYVEGLFPGFGLAGIIALALSRQQMHSVERVVAHNSLRTSLRVSISPIPGEKSLSLLSLKDMSAQRQWQRSLLEAMRNSVGQYAWIFDDELDPVYSEPSDHFRIWEEKAFKNWCLGLRDKPTVYHEASLLLKIGHRQVTVYVTGLYLPDSAGGGDYLVVARTRHASSGGVLERLREAYGAQTDTELAARLGTSASAISRARKHSVPAGWIVKGWEETGASADWLLTGKK